MNPTVAKAIEDVVVEQGDNLTGVKASSWNIFLHTSILFQHLAKQLSRSGSIDAGTLLALERHLRWTGASRKYRLMTEARTTLLALL